MPDGLERMHRNLDLLMNRFSMSPMPSRGDDRYEESLTNWFLEGVFFRHFVCRKASGKGGQGELADGLVLFRENAIFMQSKAQRGNQDSRRWLSKHLTKAVSQVSYGERMLRERLVSEVQSDTMGRLALDPDRYTERVGLIVLDQADHAPFVAHEVCPRIMELSFPVHVLSLSDLIEVATRFDTPEDLLFYLEERLALQEGGVRAEVHNEIELAQAMLQVFSERMRIRRPDISLDVLEDTREAFSGMITGVTRDSQEWRFSVLVDDIIAKMHDRDPSYQWNEGLSSPTRPIELLSALTRYRRVQIGKLLFEAVHHRPVSHYAFWRGLRAEKCCYVFLVSDSPRDRRVDLLIQLLDKGMALCSREMETVRSIGVATNTTAMQGRAYDVAMRDEALSREEMERLDDGVDPFGLFIEDRELAAQGTAG